MWAYDPPYPLLYTQFAEFSPSDKRVLGLTEAFISSSSPLEEGAPDLTDLEEGAPDLTELNKKDDRFVEEGQPDHHASDTTSIFTLLFTGLQLDQLENGKPAVVMPHFSC